MHRPRPDPFLADCPSRQLLDMIANKWALLIIRALHEGPMRTGSLQRRVGGISAKMLTQTLRALEAHGLVIRQDHHALPPHVDYRLSPLGASLKEAVGGLDRWVVDNFWTVVDATAAQASRAQDAAAPSP